MRFVDTDVINSLIADLTEVPDVTMNPGPIGAVSYDTDHQITWDVKAMQSIGEDNFIRKFDQLLDKNVVTQVGHRKFVLSVKVESFDPAWDAFEALERLRTRIIRPSSRARLLEKGMTVSSAEATSPLPTTYDQRMISAASLDIHMLLRFADVDATDDGNWIETVEPLEEDFSGA